MSPKGEFHGSLMKDGLPLLKSVPTPLAQNVLLLSGVTAAASATDTVIQKKIRHDSINISK